MSEIKTEYAFPNKESFNERLGAYVGIDSYGMSLRDYLAAQALNGMLSGRQTYLHDGQAFLTYREQSIAAYLYADEMLKAREA